MDAPMAANTISGPMTTANSASSGRLKVDVGQMKAKKRKILKKKIKGY